MSENYLAIYAAALSTLLLVWEFYKYYIDKRSRFKVEGEIRTQAVVYRNRSLGDFEKYFWITVTNLGNYKRLINKPSVESNYAEDGNNNFTIIDMEDPRKYPFPLEPGEQYQYYIEASILYNELAKKKAKKFKVKVTDTHGKTYYSKWIEVK